MKIKEEIKALKTRVSILDFVIFMHALLIIINIYQYVKLKEIVDTIINILIK